MTTDDLLDILNGAGCVLYLDAGRLHVDHPRGALAPDIQAEIRIHKAELEARLLLAEDPRPDLAEDSDLWVRLLALARAADPQLAGTLHGMRCCGTRLRRTPRSIVMQPDIDPSGCDAWPSVDAYREARERWLVPQAETIRGLLRRLAGEPAAPVSPDPFPEPAPRSRASSAPRVPDPLGLRMTPEEIEGVRLRARLSVRGEPGDAR